MEASQLFPVIMDVAHAQSPQTNLVVGQVAPAVTQGTIARVRKRQGNIVVHCKNPTSPAGKAHAPGAASAARSARPPSKKKGKVSGVKR
ncbi:hypothetical protein D1007_57578 [Hordeum vulgare]|nr:hypothetical protein D1007_57578 [Hordeum vulgare]